MKSRTYRASFGLLTLVAISCLSYGIPSTMTAYAQSTIQQHCTASNPCMNICGDHICAPGEFAQMKANATQVKLNNTVSSALPTPAVGQPTVNIVGGKVSYTAKASDGTIVVIRTGIPLSGQALPLGIVFKDSNGNFIQHQNYAIIITQDNFTILSVTAGHTHTGSDTQTTSILGSNNPLSIHITLNGVGLPTADPSTWTGVKGEVLSFSQTPDILTSTTPAVPTNATAPTLPISNMTNTISTPAVSSANATVPEFGPVVSIVLAIAITAIISVSAKTRIFPRL
ncbi:MAG: hypothetical protein KGI28_01835 [Thaumarchaeota archaeon]|nr:hypothetical protein [Nitrososphaerota archaeon]